MISSIGTLDSGIELTLPDDAVTQGFAILARRRSGKSVLAGVMEEIFCERGDPWCAIDPVAAHWGIKYRDKDGQPGGASGYDVLIVGGEHGDVPLDEQAGAALAEIIVETDINCVIDLSEVKYGARQSLKAQQVFVADFATALLAFNTTPRHILIEEAHVFVPQQIEWEGQKEARASLSRLIRNGGGKGIGFTLITQRNAEVAKSVLEQIDNLFAMRMFGPNDLKAVEGWLKHNVPDKEGRDAILQSLPALQPGEAWLCSPDWLHDVTRLQVRSRHTYHAGRTPKRGEKVVQPKAVELPAIIERFQKAAAQRQFAVGEQKDLRKEVTTLKTRLTVAERQQAPPDETVIERRVAAATTSAVAARDREHTVTVREAGRYTDRLERIVKDGAATLIGLGEKMQAAVNSERPTPALPPEMSRTVSPPARIAPEPKPVREMSQPLSQDGEGVEGLRKGAVKILRELASRYPLTVTKAQLGTLTGFTPSGGTFGTYVGELRRRGLIVLDGADFRVTESGLDAAGEVPPMPSTHDEVMAMWQRNLRAGCFKMLEVVVAAGPEGVHREDLANETDFVVSGGTFGTYLGILKRNGLVDIQGQEVRACDILFPDGLA